MLYDCSLRQIHLNITHFHYPLSNLAWVIVMADKADYMRTYGVSKGIDLKKKKMIYVEQVNRKEIRVKHSII